MMHAEADIMTQETWSPGFGDAVPTKCMWSQRQTVLQPQDGNPLWVPVSIVSSTAGEAAGSGNATAGVKRQRRWLEVFPPWDEHHRTAVAGDAVCVDLGVEGGQPCSRPLASPPLSVQSSAAVWLPKPEAGPYIASIPEQVSVVCAWCMASARSSKTCVTVFCWEF